MIFKRYPALIAEVAGNFRTVEEAVNLSEKCISKGAEIVKFQTFQTELLTSDKAMFEMSNTGRKSQKEIFDESVIDYGMQTEIFNELEIKKIPFFSTPSHPRDLDFLMKFNIKMLKIGSDDCSNLPFIRLCCDTNLPVIVSTGMAHLHEIDEMANVLVEAKQKAILHCVTNYPANLHEMNLNTINTLKNSFNEFEIGFSDHSNSILVACVARAMGASIFENHVMFDDQDFGYDRAVSMPLSSVEKFINSLRDTDIMLGSHLKQLSKSEQINRKNNRKSLHFNRVMKEGDVISSGDLIALRPGIGISPAKIDAVVGKKLLKNVADRELLEWQMFA